MSLLLYAIADEPTGVDGSEGVDGRPLRALTHAGLTAVVGEHPAELSRSAPALLAYERALERLMADATILPVHFGTALENPADVERLLSDRRDDFEVSLGRVRGAVELTLHANLSAGGLDEHSPAGSGTAYMRRLLELRRRAQSVASEVKAAFAGVARAASYVVRCDPEDAVAASFLVDDGDVDRFLDRLRELEDECDEASFVCTGPWPPYSFAEPEGL
jgi:Gas vesicle synthesis protein GvpL/GvpF